MQLYKKPHFPPPSLLGSATYRWIWSNFTSVIFFPFVFPLEAPTLMGTERFQDSQWRRRISLLAIITSFPLSLNTVSVPLGSYVCLESSDCLQSTKIEMAEKFLDTES